MSSPPTSKSVVVAQGLLNELGTLAAPSMLGIALEMVAEQVGPLYPLGMMLYSYHAEFKEGAREGDTVQVTYEETSSQIPDTKAFIFYFSKSEERLGRVGNWRLVFSQPTNNPPPLPYDINQPIADGRSDRELWRTQSLLATGETSPDSQALLWLIGQSSRRYMKRLDEVFISNANHDLIEDDPETRIYGGIAVNVNVMQWPKPGQPVRCALQYHLPLAQQTTQARKINFHGTIVFEERDITYLLGTFYFTVVRLNAQRSAIYVNGKSRI
jgi:hypothetical protein